MNTRNHDAGNVAGPQQASSRLESFPAGGGVRASERVSKCAPIVLVLCSKKERGERGEREGEREREREREMFPK